METADKASCYNKPNLKCKIAIHCGKFYHCLGHLPYDISRLLFLYLLIVAIIYPKDNKKNFTEYCDNFLFFFIGYIIGIIKEFVVIEKKS